MNSARLKNKLLFVSFLLIILVSCTHVFDDIKNAKLNISPEWGLNVVDVTLKITDTLAFETNDAEGITYIKLYPGDDGILRLNIFRQIFNLKLDSVLNLALETDALKTRKEIPFDFDFYVKGDIEFGLVLESLTKGKSIDSLKFDNANLVVKLSTYEQFYSDFSFEFSNITNPENKILKIQDFIPAVEKDSILLNLAEHKLKIVEKNGKDYLVVKTQFYIESLENNTLEKPSIEIRLEDLDLDFAYGSFGNDTIREMNQYIDLPFNRGGIFSGQDLFVDFDEPVIEFQILNSFGLPLRFDITKFDLVYDDGRIEPVTGVPEQTYINAPSLSEQNTFIPTSLELDPSTNFDVLLGTFPSYLEMEGNVFLNPDGADTKNYITDQDQLIGNLNIDLPFTVNISKINITDTLDFNIDTLANENFSTDLLRLKVDITNNFPFEMYIQGTFTDGNFNELGTLFTEPISLNEKDTLNSTPEVQTFYVDKTGDDLNNLYISDKIILNAWFSTSDTEQNKKVSIHKDHKLDISLTVFSKTSLN